MNPRDCHFNKAKGLFITGTDTGVGKTLITGGIARLLTEQGLKVGVIKPVASGCRSEMGQLVSTDAEFLAMCAGCTEPLSVITPACYKIPAAPIVCLRAGEPPIDYEQIAAMYNYLVGTCDVVLVEGIGGALVPLDEETTILDLAVQINLPTIIVARPNLGTINHSLLTIQAVRKTCLPLAGVVISGYNSATSEDAEETAPSIIAQFGQTKILAIASYDDQSSVEKMQISPILLTGLAECDWKSLILNS